MNVRIPIIPVVSSFMFPAVVNRVLSPSKVRSLSATKEINLAQDEQRKRKNKKRREQRKRKRDSMNVKVRIPITPVVSLFLSPAIVNQGPSSSNVTSSFTATKEIELT